MHVISSTDALALKKPLRANGLHPGNMLILVKRLALGRLVLHINLEMILKILSDTGQVDATIHSDRFELSRVPDARLEQQLRPVDRFKITSPQFISTLFEFDTFLKSEI